MVRAVQALALIVTAVPMALALAHALEHPGKMRLDRDQYAVTQGIYYPGFTLAGPTEPLAPIIILVLLALTPAGTRAFWLTAGAATAAALTHLLYWVLTAPVNKVWAKATPVAGPAQRLFEAASDLPSGDDWIVLRDRWEQSHLWRAVTANSAFILLAVAVVIS
jgi:hypothetical protein